MNLLPAIRETKRQIAEIKNEAERKVYDLDNGLKALRKLNTYCDECDGEGKVLRKRACAEDDRPDPTDPRDFLKCNFCNGTGRVKPRGDD